MCAKIDLKNYLKNQVTKSTIAPSILICFQRAYGGWLVYVFHHRQHGALVAFGFEERGKSIFFVLLSTSLFFLALFFPFTFIERSAYSHNYTLINITINFVGASFASAAMVYFLININHRSESQLRKNEAELSKKNQELFKTKCRTRPLCLQYLARSKSPTQLNSRLGATHGS